MPPLDGVRFKLVRAQEHAHTLESKIDAFFERDPYSQLVDFNEATWEFALRLIVRETPDPYSGVIVGDFLHNVRSALDHLVAVLVRANGKKVSRQTQFPIFTDRCRFEVIGIPLMQGAAAEAQAVIQELQPYHRLHPDEHPLELLRVLSNTDKHRLLYAVLPSAKHIENLVSEAIGSSRIEVHELAAARPIEGETVVLRGRVIPGPDFENVKMRPQLVAEIVLSDGTRFEDFIDPTLSFVRDQVVPRLERFAEPAQH